MPQPHATCNDIVQNISQVIVGKQDALLFTIATLLCRGHLLIEDAPGLGKTMLARALARSLDGECKRLQGTPDLLPTDVTGVSVYHQHTTSFAFMPGPIFTNILLVDEINRATPRTQSSLLEAMAESQVSVDGQTYALPDVFMVIATQNPVEYQGTYALPEAQLDRFFMRISLGYPSLEDELHILDMHKDHHPITDLLPVMTLGDLQYWQKAVTQIYVDAAVARYIADIVRATRQHTDVLLGASPRGTVALYKAAQAMAYLMGQAYVDPHTVKQVAVPVLAHRVLVTQHAQLRGQTGIGVVQEVLAHVSVPVSGAPYASTHSA